MSRTIDDQEIRAGIVGEIEAWRVRAALEARRALVAGDEAKAAHLKRVAEHYQQAIDMLTKAPMPEANDESR